METEKLQTGKDVLASVEEKVKIDGQESLRCVLTKSVVMIQERQRWIAARTSQIERLKEMQVEMVKLYDSGKFGQPEAEFFKSAMATVGAEKVSKDPF